MRQHVLARTSLAFMLALGGITSCAKSDQKQEGTLVDSLPSIVASVNGFKIDRATVRERFQQALSMKAHQQHIAQMVESAQQGSAQSAGESVSSSNSDVTHAQHALDQMSQDQDKALLRTIINLLALEQLKVQEAARLGLTISPEVLEQNVQAIEKQAGSRKALEEQLKQGHTTVDQWRSQLRDTLLFQLLAEHRRKALPVSDEEIRRYWDRHGRSLSKLWHTDRWEPVQHRIRDLIQQDRWRTAEGEWHYELVKNAKIWVDPVVRQQLAEPTAHAHSQ